MAVGTLTIQLPIRAMWWVKHLALKEGVTERKWLEGAVLRALSRIDGVDLSRSPVVGER
jgi:hypothetical protein